MSFLKVLGKTEFRFEFSVKNYVFQHGTISWHLSKSDLLGFAGAVSTNFSLQKAPAGLLNLLISWPFQLIIWFIIRINIKLFSYLATCGWLFDGFFSHWQLAVESILQLANSSDSTISRRIFGSGAGALGCPPRGPGPRAASENPSTDRWIAWIRQLKDGFDGQLPMGEESIE